MPKCTYSAMDRVPESERVRIGFRHTDTLEDFMCRTCWQKIGATTLPFLVSYVFFKEYQQKYGHYPILRASGAISMMGLRQMVHFAVPVLGLVMGIHFSELTYNRCVLGLQGAEALPDQIIKRNK